MKRTKREYSKSIFGDLRLDRRLEQVCERLCSQMNATVPEASVAWKAAKGTYRLWDNGCVTPDRQVSYYFNSRIRPLLESRPDCRRVLQISDTMELDYTHHRCAAQLGPLSHAKQRGLHLHNSLLTNNLGHPLGLLQQTYHVRLDELFGQSVQRAHVPLREKESARWLQHFQTGQELCRQDPALEVVFIADREADILELFAQRSQANMHFVIRSRHDRKLADGMCNLVTSVNGWPAAGRLRTKVFNRKTRKWRDAQLEIRFGAAQIKLHHTLPHKRHLPAIPLHVVDIKEITPSVESEERIHWRLLTTLAVQTMAEAFVVFQYYLLRWLIERFHFLLKSGGASVEKLQLATPQRLKNAITTYSIAAMDAFNLRYLCENNPDEPIFNVGISPIEYQVLYTYAQKQLKLKVKYDPESPPTVRQYCITLGQIAGFFPSKRQPVPGLVILTRALEKLQHFVDAYLTFCQ